MLTLYLVILLVLNPIFVVNFVKMIISPIDYNSLSFFISLFLYSFILCLIALFEQYSFIAVIEDIITLTGSNGGPGSGELNAFNLATGVPSANSTLPARGGFSRSRSRDLF